MHIKHLRNHILSILFLTIAVAGVYEALFGLCVTRSSLGISGHFGNPAGFAAFLAALLPFAFYFTRLRKKLPVAFGIATTGIMLTAIALSLSRSGLVAALIVVIVTLWPRLIPFWRRLSRRVHYASLCTVGILFVAVGVGLYLLKKDSADGRLLIWRNTAEMIADKPFLGHGSGGFQAKYMLYQADYFRTHPDSRYAPLADNVRVPFNEYLGIAAEYGIVGVLLLGGLIASVLRENLRRARGYKRTAAFSLLAVGITALFSYPFHYPAVLIIMAVDFVVLAGMRRDWSAWVGQTSAFCFLWLAVQTAEERVAQQHWQKRVDLSANDISLTGRFEQLATTKAGASLSFLYGYGAALNRAGEYARSAEVLERCFLRWADADIAVILTDNYYRLGDYVAAERWAVLAANMCPNRFMPLYKLVSIYDSLGQPTRALELAKVIVDKSVKIPSGTVSAIKLKMRKRIDSPSE